jgi:hypothetical protein
MAERQGLKLVKSRRRDPKAIEYGTYQLIDPYKNEVKYSRGDSYNHFGLSLDTIEEILTGE